MNRKDIEIIQVKSEQWVWVDELQMYGRSISYMVELEEDDIHVMSLESLKELKDTQIREENYESIHIIDKAIKNKL